MIHSDYASRRLQRSLASKRGTPTLLPDPGPQELYCPLISVDDHFLEPLNLFDELPKSLKERAPYPIWNDDGVPYWMINGVQTPITVTDGAAGRPMAEWNLAQQKFTEFRDGVHNVHARIRDMDLNGIWASLNFPSTVWGFCGTQFARIPDAAVGLACVKVYNDWVHSWCSTYPNRFIACQLPWLGDPVQAAAEIERNACRGFKAVTFSENPEGLGLPSLYSEYWDPFFSACEATRTVVNLHVGSSGSIVRPSAASPPEVSVCLFPLNGIMALVNWIYARIPLKFPNIQIVLSEAGASWVPMALERLRRAYRQVESSDVWGASDPHPVDIAQRNFWFTSIEDPSAFRVLDLIGEDHLMVESDYPHKDSSWPYTQRLIQSQLKGHTETTVRKVCFGNAAKLYRHPGPPGELIKIASF